MEHLHILNVIYDISPIAMVTGKSVFVYFFIVWIHVLWCEVLWFDYFIRTLFSFIWLHLLHVLTYTISSLSSSWIVITRILSRPNICFNRINRQDAFWPDKHPKYYIDYNRIHCYPDQVHGVDFTCSSCSPGRWCIPEGRCILDENLYHCWAAEE